LQSRGVTVYHDCP